MRILTTLRIANHGGILFADSLQRAMASAFPHYEARYLDYIPRDRKYYEWLRMFKPHRKAPLFNLLRHNHLQKFINQSVPHERLRLAPFGYERMIKLLARHNYDALVVSMVIWDITYKAYLSNFPNAYWLSEKIPAVKIAYAVSGHRTNLSLVKQFSPHIKRILDSYALIGVRDDLTAEIVTESKLDARVPVMRIPDPTFLYEYGATQARQILARYGIDLNRPILGLLVYMASQLFHMNCVIFTGRQVSRSWRRACLTLMPTPTWDTSSTHMNGQKSLIIFPSVSPIASTAPSFVSRQTSRLLPSSPTLLRALKTAKSIVY
jgi:hypothetical protein